MPAKEKIIVALDVPSAEAALQVAQKLHGHVGMFKVGSEVFTAEGPVTARYLVATGEQVFLDLKFHDIPNTVRAAAHQAGMMGVSLLTVHASGGRKMMEAAMDGVRAAAKARGVARPTRVLAVTALTSLGAEGLAEVGQGPPEVVVVRLARLAQAAGVDGVVASPREIVAIRQACGPNFLIVTPGIRPLAGTTDDQARTATPESAIRAGADFLVIGRPITGAADPAAAADAIAAEMEKALTVILSQAQKTMTENEILDIFRKHSALLEGHFVLSSGLHSDRYVQCALVLQHPRLAEQLCSQLADQLRHLGAAVVAAPALGGVLVAHEVARALGVRALFTERQEGAMTLRRGFSLNPGEPTLVVEDVITTGLSTRETIQCVEQAGGKVVGAGALIDRSGGAADLGLPKAALITLKIQNYNPSECPLCEAGIPAIKPGSRTKK